MTTPVPASGAISISALKAAFPNINSNRLSDYEGVKWYKSNNSRGYFPSGANAYISMSAFYDTRHVSPVVPGSQSFPSSTTFQLPLFNILTFTVWGGGGGGGGGAAMNSTWGKGADGNSGSAGTASTIQLNNTTIVTAAGGGGGGGGIRNSSNDFSGTNGAGGDGVYGMYGAGGSGYNDGTTGARSGGRGGLGGKTVLVWNANINESLLSNQNQNIDITIGSRGNLGTGATISIIIGWVEYTQSGSSGANGQPGYATISWT